MGEVRAGCFDPEVLVNCLQNYGSKRPALTSPVSKAAVLLVKSHIDARNAAMSLYQNIYSYHDCLRTVVVCSLLMKVNCSIITAGSPKGLWTVMARLRSLIRSNLISPRTKH